jgi:hemerythrin
MTTNHMRWSEALLGTGVPAVDAQHRELFSRVNDLLDACARGEGGAAIRPTLDSLGEYIEAHFTEEEALMTDRRCSAAAQNKAAHDLFRERYNGLRGDLIGCRNATEMAMLVLEVQRTVCDWLTDHIMQIDTKLRDAPG